MIFEGAPHNADKAKRLEDAYAQFDNFLSKTAWAAGDHMTVADLSLLASVTTAEVTKTFSPPSALEVTKYGKLIFQACSVICLRTV